MLLPLIGAGLGGYEAYRQSGGNVGATLLGAGLGAVTPAALRMAGTALGARLGAEALGKASGAVTGQALKANLAARALGETGAQGVARNVALAGSRQLAGLGGKLGTAAGLGGIVAGAGLGLGAANLAGGIAGAVGRRGQANQAGQLPVQYGAGYLGTRPYETDYGAGLESYDPNVLNRIQQSVYGSTPLDVIGLKGLARTAETMREAAAQADAMRRTGEVEQRFLNVAKAKDLERNIAAAVARGNITTQLGMLSQAQMGAQDIASRAMTGLSQGLAQQYQYS